MKNGCVLLYLIATAFALRVEPASAATPRVLQVGPTRTYLRPSQAAAVSLDGDVIEIDAGTYSGDVCSWSRNNLVIRGVGAGRAHLPAAGQSAQQKGIWVISGSNTTVENIEFSGAAVPDLNGAGIRQEGAGLTVRNCYFHDNENGILSGANASSDILVEYCEFSNNGAGDGYSHNMYIGNVRTFTLQHSYSHLAKIGHLVKSRAQTNFILYNRLTCEATGTASYEINLPNGGRSYIIGNLIHQGPNADNPALISFAEEGASNTVQELYVINNTLVNDRSAGATFVRVAGAPAQSRLTNNIFMGTGVVLSGAGTLATNLVSNSPGLVNAAAYDYHLTSTSAAINAGSDPGTGAGINLAPAYQYLHSVNRESRPVSGVIDIGAYEFGTVSPPPPPPPPPPPAQPPTVATAASASPNPVTAKTASLTVLGADDGGEAALTYTWSTTGTPPASVALGANGTNAAKTTTATFIKSGAYTFQVLIKDAGNLSATSTVALNVNQTLTGLTINPASSTVNLGSTQTFAALATDQFGNAMPSSVAWSTTGGGTVSVAGVYSASGPSGIYSVTATSGSLTALASITIPAPTIPGGQPTFASPPSVSSTAVVVGEPVQFSVSASDPDGDALAISWGFGDGATATGATATHAYSAPGTYSAVVSVSDGIHPALTQTIVITISGSPITPISIKINFQAAGSQTLAGYHADDGAPFGDRGKGMIYGWNMNNSAQARDRNAANSPDQRYDTFTHMQKPVNPNAVWEIALPNGTYRVRAVSGDPSYFDSIYRIAVENVLTVNANPTARLKWFDGTQTVTVSDGRLTISNAAGAVNNKLCFVEIDSGVAATFAAVDVPEAAPLIVTKLKLSMNFAKSSRDSYRVAGSLPALPRDFSPAGQIASIDIGAAIASFLLNPKGRGSSTTGSFSIKLNKSKGWLFKASLKKGDGKDKWSDGNLQDETTTGRLSEIPVTLTLGSQVFGGSKALKYTAKKEKKGVAK